MLLKALGWSRGADPASEFGDVRVDARHPGEGPHRRARTTPCSTSTASCARASRRPARPRRRCWTTCYFNPKRYDLAKVGRYKINKKLGLDAAARPPGADASRTSSRRSSTWSRCTPASTRDSRRRAGRPIVEADDIDHFGNRRLRTVGELIQNQVRTGLARMERVVRERMTTQDVEAITPQTLINIRPVVAAIKEFFGTSQLSQFMDQTNPLAGLTHKRRLSALGPGGLSRERAGFEVRDVHPSHYGRMCPIETPEGPNIGLIGSLSTYAPDQPVRLRRDARTARSSTARSPTRSTTSPRTRRTGTSSPRRTPPLDRDGRFAEDRVLVRRKGGEVELRAADDVDYMDVSPRQMVSVATAMIPFLEHDDANRALMGSNMQRQAVPLVARRGAAGRHRHGVPRRGRRRRRRRRREGRRGHGGVAPTSITVMNDDGTARTYRLAKFRRSNQGTCVNQKPIVDEGDAGRGRPGHRRRPVHRRRRDGARAQPARGVHAVGGPQLRGRDHPLASAWCRTTSSPRSTSRSTRSTPATPSWARRRSPGTSRTSPRRSWPTSTSAGIIRIGAEVVPGDILVGKVTPKGETELTPEERLLRAIFGEKAREVRDTSLKVPHGESGTVIGVRVFDREDGDELPPGVNQLVRVYVAQKRKITDGDKLAGRHGNKGVISKILPVEDMPFLEDGTPVDIVLNPLGVPRPDERRPGPRDPPRAGWPRPGWAGRRRRRRTGSKRLARDRRGRVRRRARSVADPVFDGASEDEITGLLGVDLPEPGRRAAGRRGRQGASCSTGAPVSRSRTPVAVGYIYILKLHHLVDDKIHARSTGPYSMITQQPLGGKAQFGGQRFGEMEVLGPGGLRRRLRPAGAADHQVRRRARPRRRSTRRSSRARTSPSPASRSPSRC